MIQKVVETKLEVTSNSDSYSVYISQSQKQHVLIENFKEDQSMPENRKFCATLHVNNTPFGGDGLHVHLVINQRFKGRARRGVALHTFVAMHSSVRDTVALRTKWRWIHD